MENKLQIFKNKDFGELRTLEINGEIYFAGKDVATILGYSDTDKAIRDHVEKEDKQLFKPADLAGKTEKSFDTLFKAAGYNWKFVPGSIPNRGLIFINESGVYSLVLSSKLPKAKEFKHWVTSEVLPSIRKTGKYSVEDREDEDRALAFLAVSRKKQIEEDLKSVIQQIADTRQTLSSQEDLFWKHYQSYATFCGFTPVSLETVKVSEVVKEIKNLGHSVSDTYIYNLCRQRQFFMENQEDEAYKARGDYKISRKDANKIIADFF